MNMTNTSTSKIHLGEFLVKQGLITDEQLKEILLEQQKTGEKLGNIVISKGMISEENLVNLLSKQLNIPVYNLLNFVPNKQIARLIPEAHARRLQALVLEKHPDGFVVGMVDPLNIAAIDDLSRILNNSVHVAIVAESQLNKTLDATYQHTEEITNLADKLYEELSDGKIALVDLAAKTTKVDAPVVGLLQSLFEDAIQANASDIHIEPDEDLLRIRTRIDGILNEQIIQEKEIAQALAIRLKIISGLNVAEKRLPQDGRFNIKIKNRIIDVRLSLLPTQYGESMVMRLLDPSHGLLDLDQVIQSKSILKTFREILRYPHGLILTTGPTGSGKTTTLYAALSELNTATKKIITAEDPVEYRIPRINQVQINTALNLSFAAVLRSVLRQDPNIILVGEMRDQETANIAIRAALTGHLVLSSLHTNDAADSALRLIDMGIDGYLVAATLRGIIAQRLVRKICDGCKTTYKLTENEINWLKKNSDTNIIDTEFAYGKGCNFCNQSGYKGRIAIFELLVITPELQDALRSRNPSHFLKEATANLKGRLLVNNAIEQAIQKSTTLEEAMRIAGDKW